MLKDQFLEKQDIKSFALFCTKLRHKQQNSSWRRFLFLEPIPITTFITGLFAFTQPLASGMSYGSFIFNSFLSDYGWRSELLDHNAVITLKKLLTLISAVKYMESNFYQQRLFFYLTTKWEEFVAILDKYKNAEKKDRLEIEEEIKKKIDTALTTSFYFWLYHKNFAFKNREFWVNLAFNTPTFASILKSGIMNIIKKEQI